MLVLSRKKNEAILIGNDIKIVVIDIIGNKVRLGIQAPNNLSVHRHEVYESIVRKGDNLMDVVRKPKED